MKRIGKYCKAYAIDELRKFSGWNERAQEEQARDITEETDLSNILFVQEDYTVTAGIFVDENVILNEPTPEWIEFCRDTLKFDPSAIDPRAESSPRPA
jgi:hypothetical protein